MSQSNLDSELLDCLLTLRAPANGPSPKKSLHGRIGVIVKFIARVRPLGVRRRQKGTPSSDTHAQTRNRGLLADLGFVPPTFYKDDPRFIEKLDAPKLYMFGKQMAFEDLTQRFPAMNNKFSKNETQQKMIYAQAAKTQEEQLRFFKEHGPKAWLIANRKLGQPAALLPRPSVPPSSTALKAQLNKKITLRVFKLHQQLKVQQTSQDTSKKAQAQETWCINLEFKYFQSIQITTKRQASQSTSLPLTPPQRWRISERNGQNNWSAQAFPDQHQQDGTQRFMEEDSRVKQPNKASHAYADRARAVSLAECVLIAEIHNIILDQPPSRYLIDAYLMCLTAGARLRHRQSNDNQRAQNRERRVEWNGTQSRMDKYEAPEDDDDLLG
ncbi:MAG: hypothetical protein EZS28_035506 [Streblomastix strix]|uniref:Uncharacterized protein n=1 Tax=Streblomastix strix TaxID=222440 RepID=A0A5J4UEY5_9EUKA|nr:MAG: hypothetical protein EZS28_035506 [Streblomastix strix]